MLLLLAFVALPIPTNHKQSVCDKTDVFFDSLKFYKTGSDSLRAALHYSVGASRARMEHTDIRSHATRGICGLMGNLKGVELPPKIAFVAMLRDPIDRLVSALNMAATKGPLSALRYQRTCCTPTSSGTYDCSSAAIRRIPDCALHVTSRPDLKSNRKLFVNTTESGRYTGSLHGAQAALYSVQKSVQHAIPKPTVAEIFKACSWHRPCGQVTSKMMIQQAHACASTHLGNAQPLFLWPIATYAPVFQPGGDSVSSMTQYLADNFIMGTTQNMTQLFSLLSRVLRSNATATAECMEPYFEYNPASANVHQGGLSSVVLDQLDGRTDTRDELVRLAMHQQKPQPLALEHGWPAPTASPDRQKALPAPRVPQSAAASALPSADATLHLSLPPSLLAALCHLPPGPWPLAVASSHACQKQPFLTAEP